MTQSWPAHEHAREFLWMFDRFCIIPNLQLTLDSGPGLEFRFVLDPTVPKGTLWTLWWNTSDDDPTQSPALTWPCTILVRWFRLMVAWSDGDLTWHPNCSPVHPSSMFGTGTLFPGSWSQTYGNTWHPRAIPLIMHVRLSTLSQILQLTWRILSPYSLYKR